jgi:hypothetical protein
MDRRPSVLYVGLLAVLVVAGATLACWLPGLRAPPPPPPPPPHPPPPTPPPRGGAGPRRTS